VTSEMDEEFAFAVNGVFTLTDDCVKLTVEQKRFLQFSI
jgi:hypothetical protein